jgi:hypothetical protein
MHAMGGIGSKILLGLATCVAACIGVAGTAGAAATVVADPICCTYTGGPFVQGMGEIANFQNASETTYHDTVSTQNGPDGKPLFGAEPIPGLASAPLAGTQYLKAGTYPFFCTLHGSAMSGDLVIDGSGTPVPRPSVKATFVAQKLKALRKSGVRIKLRAATAVKGVRVVATKGKVVIGSKSGIALGAGKSRVYTLPLTKAGRKAVRKGKFVQVTVKSTVPFGKPSSATRKVR